MFIRWSWCLMLILIICLMIFCKVCWLCVVWFWCVRNRFWFISVWNSWCWLVFLVVLWCCLRNCCGGVVWVWWYCCWWVLFCLLVFISMKMLSVWVIWLILMWLCCLMSCYCWCIWIMVLMFFWLKRDNKMMYKIIGIFLKVFVCFLCIVLVLGVLVGGLSCVWIVV